MREPPSTGVLVAARDAPLRQRFEPDELEAELRVFQRARGAPFLEA